MPDDPATPSFAGRYRIERELGRGGMATVYLARDDRNGRPVALKVLHEELAHALGRERFQREIAITANLTHPNILPLHDSGEADGRFFYVMPYVEGETLRQRLDREQQLPLREAVCIARGVATALAHAHARGIIHRDIKPENILIAGGQPLVADFGIARALEAGGERLTGTGLSLGTPAYMSPEQASADPSIDARSDIYSLGCVLYEMLAGEPPFTGPNTQAVVAKRLAAPAPPIRTVRDTVPDSLAHALECALARVPADRYQTAAELRAALDEAEVDCTMTGVSGPRSAGRTASRASRRPARPAQIAVAAGALLAVTALVGAGFWLTRPTAVEQRVHTLAVLPLASLAALAAPMNGMAAPATMAGGGGMNVTGMNGTDMNSAGMAGDVFADGLTDALITGLSQLGSVNVISLTSVMQYRMMKKPIAEVARELDADMLLEGAVLRSGDRVRISAKLLRPDGTALWADSYERSLGDALALQTDVADAVAQGIGVKLVAEGRTAPPPVKPAAQEAYLKGTYFAKQWRLEEAIAELQRAVGIDPGHTAAYAALARAYYFRAFFGEVAPAEAFSQMRRAATRALERDARLAEAHGLTALVATHYDWEWDAADRHFRRALALSPSNAQVHHDYAHFLLAAGRQAESVVETKRALALDPANPMLTSCVGWHSLFDKRFAEAGSYADEAQRMMPSFWAHVVRGWAYLGEAKPDSAVAAMRAADALSNGLPFTRAALAHALAKTGHIGEARKLLAALLEQSLTGYVSAFDVAIVYAGLGENDQALAWLRKAMGERSMFVVHLSWDPRLDGLRSDPRFVELVRQIGAPDAPPPARRIN